MSVCCDWACSRALAIHAQQRPIPNSVASDSIHRLVTVTHAREIIHIDSPQLGARNDKTLATCSDVLARIRQNQADKNHVFWLYNEEGALEPNTDVYLICDNGNFPDFSFAERSMSAAQ